MASASISRMRFANMERDARDKHPAVRRQKEDFGYPIYLVREPTGVVVSSGCRWYSLERALAHWSSIATQPLKVIGCTCCMQCQQDTRNRKARARKMTALLPLLEKRARRLGWLPASKKS